MIAWALLEIGLRLFFPQATLYPRWAFSAKTCSTLYPGVTMIHERLGRWRFEYSINRVGHRGKEVPVRSAYELPNIVVLGDSYAFGTGVPDGDEFSSILERALGGSVRVINLAVGGWGLTQEIRRYEEFGSLYAPQTVILQFSANDPRDNLKCPVTDIENGHFVYRDTAEGIFRIKRTLSHSWIQKSQLYNLVRDRLYRLAEARVVSRTQDGLPGKSHGSPVEEDYYARLLRLFAQQLRERNTNLIFITVNDQIGEFPRIAKEVRALSNAGYLQAIDAAEWLRGGQGYSSPEGHLWGSEAHRIIGERLAGVIRSSEPLSDAEGKRR